MPNCAPSLVFRPLLTSPWLDLGSFWVLIRVLTPRTWWAPQAPPKKWGTKQHRVRGELRSVPRGTALVARAGTRATREGESTGKNSWRRRRHRFPPRLSAPPRAPRTHIAKGAARPAALCRVRRRGRRRVRRRPQRRPRRRACHAREAQRGTGRRDRGAAFCPDAVTCACSRASGVPRDWQARVAPKITAVRHALTVEHTQRGCWRRASRFFLNVAILASCASARRRARTRSRPARAAGRRASGRTCPRAALGRA